MVVWKMQPSFSSSRRRAAAAALCPPPGRGVGEVAVVSQSKLNAVSHAHEQRLRIAQLRLARGGVAYVADGRLAGEMPEVFFAEHVGDKSHADMQMGGAFTLVPRNDTRAFLAAMLQGIQTEVGEPGGVLMTGDAENTAHVPSLRQKSERPARNPGRPQWFYSSFSVP